MRNDKFKTFFLPAKLTTLSLFMMLILTACGGGGGSTTTEEDDTGSAAISGSVSGTLVIAVNDNGEIVSIDDTTGRTPDVDRDNDGIDESFSFTLEGIPAGTYIRLYLISEGQTFPLYFDSDDDGTPDANVMSLSESSSLALGFIDTADHGYTGKSIPQNNPTDMSGITSGGEDSEIPEELQNPDTAGLSVTELIENGLSYLVNGAALMARTYLAEAVDDTIAGSASGNAARFFYAVTRVVAVAYETYSDRNSTDFNEIGDILHGFGIDRTGTVRSNFDAIAASIDQLTTLPENSPTGADIQTWIENGLIAELEAAITNLDAVTPGFSLETTLPDGTDIEFDYGDVLVVRAAFKTFLAVLQFQASYNLDADIDEIANNFDTMTVESFLSANTDFLTIGTSRISDVKANILSGVDDLQAAVAFMQSETDDQTDDLINFSDISADEIAEFLAYLETIENGLTEEQSLLVYETMNTDWTSDDLIFDLYPLFTGLELRDLLPSFSGNKAYGLFPDPTFGGLVTEDRGWFTMDDYDNSTWEESPDGILDIYGLDDLFFDLVLG